MNQPKALILILLLVSCGTDSDDENNASKRNSNWAWHVSLDGVGQWVPIGSKIKVPDGLATSFYDNGLSYSKTKIVGNEREDTTWYFHHEIEGQLIKIHVETDLNESWWYPEDGPYVRYYQDGALHEVGDVASNEHGEDWKVYHSNGKPSFIDKRDFDAGTRRYSNYFPSGQISDTAEFLNGLAHGTSKIWNEQGILEEYVEWKNGVESGKVRFYFPDGTIKKETEFVDGLRDGVEKRYYENGQLMYISGFVEGIRSGIVELYFESGNTSQKANMIDGVPIGEYFYESGQLFAISEFVNDSDTLSITSL